MCGIAGVVSFSDELRVTREVLSRMAARIAHRGPDGEAFYLNHEDASAPGRPQVGMAFRRLAVLDPNPRAMQPMSTPDGRFTLVFNGEIYNFRTLRAELSALCPQYVWTTTGDSEVLLMALATWGTAALEKLNGMFAFALWDEREKSLLLARDPMGQKPLYFSRGRGSVAFASELRALRPWPDWEQEIDRDALIEYLRFGCIGAPATLENGTAQVLPGHYVEIREPGDPSVQAGYFDPNQISRAPHDDFRTLIEQAVTRQLVSDVPLGVFLSGGIDSSVIALCARKSGAVKTFSIGFDDPRYDESAHAREVAKYLGTEHHEFRVTPDAAGDLPRLAEVFGDPFADSSALPTHYLARETRKHVTVALSGDGGDELFGGYDRYRAMRLPVGWLRPFTSLGNGLARGHPKALSTRIGRLLQSSRMPPGERYRSYLAVFGDEQVAGLLGAKPQAAGDWGRLWEELRAGRGVVETALAIDRARYLPNDLLTKVDRASMLHALEVRSPFMDPHLVHAASMLPRGALFGGGKKRVLRELFSDELPASVFLRAKMGFAVPIGDWLRTSLRGMLRDHLFASESFARQHFDMAYVERLEREHADETADHSQRLYALLMLELRQQVIDAD
jgi:asparagine synthase (glutamine-hydrolysing)